MKKLISGGFVPAVSRTQVSGGGECGKFIPAAFTVFPFTLHIPYKVEQAGIVTDSAAERSVEYDGFPGNLSILPVTVSTLYSAQVMIISSPKCKVLVARYVRVIQVKLHLC